MARALAASEIARDRAKLDFLTQASLQQEHSGDALLDRLGIQDGPGVDSVLETLNHVDILPRVIEDFRPIHESLEWKLSELHWRSAGLQSFVENDVPYTINNSGQLSSRAAALLFANCAEAPGTGPIRVLEIGAGSGLFARYLLDEFRELSKREGRDYYDRLTFHITDGSPRTVEQWASTGLYDAHREHVVTAVCNALDPQAALQSDGAAQGSRLQAAFCNYLLDSLPCSILRKGTEGIEELHVRTHLTPDATRVSHYTPLTLDQMRELARLQTAEDRAKLIPLVSLLEFEAAFLRTAELPPYSEEAVAFDAGQNRVLHNFGALQSLEAILALLSNDGFILINDYGAVTKESSSDQAVSQRFGPTTALGLNFPLLEHHFSVKGIGVARPDQDDALPIHPRLLTRKMLPGTQEIFLRTFGGAAYRELEQPGELARKHQESGRLDLAMDAYKQAVARNPRDWRLLGEVAEFLIRRLADYESGLKLARTAVAMNPWFSSWLWNVLGDALFALNRFPQAHEAYLVAQRMDATDPRTNLNLAYSYAELCQFPEAFSAIAAGLAHDLAGVYRDRLLEKQQRLLGQLTARYNSEQEWQGRRAALLRGQQ